MKSCDMVIVVPMDKLTGNDEAVRLQVWGTVSELLRPGLGKLYRRFQPSDRIGDEEILRPFGVVLGSRDPVLFRKLLAAGEEAQREAITFHALSLLRKADLDSAQKIGDTLFCPTVVDGNDPELLAHTAWHLWMREGRLLPDCGIYYAARKRAFSTEAERSEIRENAERYALCMVNLSPEVQENA